MKEEPCCCACWDSSGGIDVASIASPTLFQLSRSTVCSLDDFLWKSPAGEDCWVEGAVTVEPAISTTGDRWLPHPAGHLVVGQEKFLVHADFLGKQASSQGIWWDSPPHLWRKGTEIVLKELLV